MTPPECRVLADALIARATTDNRRLAFDDGRRQVTYGQLAERAEAYATALARQGVGPGDRVAMALAAGVEFAEVFWGLQLLGAVPCAFNPTATRPPLAQRVTLVRPRLVIDAVPRLHGRGEPPGDPGTSPEDLAFIQPTSGTSGHPRGAQVRQRHVLAFLRTADQVGQVTDRDVLVAWVPPWHDLGLVRFIIGAVYHGAPCHIVRPAVTTIPAWLQTISRVGGTASGAPDFAFRLATRMVDPATVDLRSLRFLTNGGEPVRRSTIEEFESRFDLSCVVQPGYGLAEATLGVTAHRLGTPIVVDGRGNVSCGQPLPGVEVRAGDAVRAPAEILVRAPHVFAGYFAASEDSRERLRDGWLHTGDSGYLDAAGRLYVLGRRRGMIKRGGVVIAPRELEEAAQTVPGVRLAAAIGVADRARDRDTIALVVEADDAEAQRPRIEAEVTRRIADGAGFAPDRVIVTPPRTIPRTENGKVRHERLSALVAGGRIGETTTPSAGWDRGHGGISAPEAVREHGADDLRR